MIDVMSLKPADDVISNRLTEVHGVWKRIAGGRLAPRRDELAPSLLRNALPWIWVVDSVDGGADFRFRLAGDRVIQFMGQRYSGSLLSKHLDGAFFKGMKAMFGECLRRRAPVASGPRRASLEGKEFLDIEVLALPLSEDGKTVTALFGAIDVRPRGGFSATGPGASV